MHHFWDSLCTSAVFPPSDSRHVRPGGRPQTDLFDLLHVRVAVEFKSALLRWKERFRAKRGKFRPSAALPGFGQWNLHNRTSPSPHSTGITGRVVRVSDIKWGVNCGRDELPVVYNRHCAQTVTSRACVRKQIPRSRVCYLPSLCMLNVKVYVEMTLWCVRRNKTCSWEPPEINRRGREGSKIW